MDDFRSSTLICFIGKELRFFDVKTHEERHVNLNWMRQEKYHYSSNWIDNKDQLLLTGGYNSKKSYTVIDLTNGSRLLEGEYNQERYWHGTTRIGKYGYIVFGQSGPKSIEKYDWDKDTWEVFMMDHHSLGHISDTIAAAYKKKIYISIYDNMNFVVWNPQT